MFGINNPSWLLQPWRNLTQFTQELYAALDRQRGATVTQEGPVVIKVKEGQEGLRIERSGATSEPVQQSYSKRERPASEPPMSPQEYRVSRARERTGRQSPGVEPYEPPARTASGVDAQAPDRRKRESPLFSVNGPAEFKGETPVRFHKPPELWDDEKKQFYTPKPWKFPDDLPVPTPSAGGNPGTTVFVGKVVSCDPGGPAQVLLYPNGTTADPSPADPVDVDLPSINADEDLDGVQWLTNVFEFKDHSGNKFYECFPPIWSS